MIRRELIYLLYYFDVQLRQIIDYYLLGVALGSIVSVFGKSKIHGAFEKLNKTKMGALGIIPASVIGIASPLCMYGTIPIAASFSEKGMRDDWLAAFMMTSILLNPQLIIYSTALGPAALAVRIASTFLCGCAAGLCVRFFWRGKKFFNFNSFREPEEAAGDARDDCGDSALSVSRDGCVVEAPAPETSSRRQHPVIRLLKSILRNFKATGLYFLIGVALSAVFQRYVPEDAMINLFGKNEAFGVLMAATVGVPLYACGGGTIPLLQQWLGDGMSLGSAAAFMITGPATKITNLGALKIALGVKNFILYFLFIMVFAFITGAAVNGVM